MVRPAVYVFAEAVFYGVVGIGLGVAALAFYLRPRDMHVTIFAAVPGMTGLVLLVLARVLMVLSTVHSQLDETRRGGGASFVVGTPYPPGPPPYR